MNTYTLISSLRNKIHKLCLLTILTVATTVFSSQKAEATHAAGADLTYRCLGGLQYEIEATFYRDCGGVAEPSTITINYKSVSKGVNLTVTANKIAGTGQEITVPCQTSSSTCGGGSSTGIRKFVYRATVTLSSAATDWVFSYSVCCRNCSITTINNPCASTSLIYVEAKLNNQLASCNSSPVFSNIPIAFVCIGQNFNYNHGVLDADGDSLAYQIITPKISETATVTYLPPNSTTMPVQSSTPFNVNALTGDMNFTPTLQQIGILAILVKEYRNGQLIGSVIRDMQVYTVPCTNSLPTATGINGSNNFSVNVCPNQQVCFNINTNDADAAQVVTVATNIAQSFPTATVTISNAARPVINFCWTPTTADIGPNPNTFTVTVKDNACPSNGVQTFSYNIYVPGPDFNVTSANVTCNGANNGTATAVPVSGTGLTYSWNTTPVQTTATATNLAPGTYSVTVTNSGGCSLTKSVTITQPPALSVTNTITNVVCVGQCNGGVDLTATGGTGTLLYAWSNGQTTQDVTGLCAGTYTVTVTDANACSKVMNPEVLTTSNIAGTITSTNILCNGNSTGSATITVSGGAGQYQYLWSNGATGPDLTNVAAGNYAVTVSDETLCSKSFNVNLTQPSAALSLSNTVTTINCFGNSTGGINITAAGGTTPYSFAWSNGATTQNISNVAAGTYTVTVTDANGCTAAQTSVNVSQPAAALSATAAQTDVNCFGNNTGSINITPSGGTSPYSYQWSNGASTQDLSNISAGTYSVTITDSKGCTTSVSAIALTQPSAALTSSVTSTNVNCFGNATGTITLTANGGTTPYSFAWSNGSTTQNLNGINAGTYSVTVTDANGCTSAQNSIAVSQPTAGLSASHTTTNVNCFGNNTGAINMTITGGTTPYAFNWSNGANTQNLTNIPAGTYSVTVTDANGCTNATASMTVSQPSAALSSNNYVTNVNCYGNSTGAIDITVQGGTIPYSYQWSNNASSQDINNIPAGTYTVTITDANGCTTASMSMNVTQPSAALAASVSGTQQVNCFGNATGSANISVTGGTSPYTYLWSNGATSQNIANVQAGTYTVSVTDANGCNSTVASINITQPAASLATFVSNIQSVSCNGGSTGSVDISVSGGTTPYSYNWSNGATSQNLNNVPAGTYTVTVTDANGCTAVSAPATITQPTALTGSLNLAINTSCLPLIGNGVITLNVSGGVQPYSFNWSNGATTQVIASLLAGHYSVTVTDANGCSLTLSADLNALVQDFELSATASNSGCDMNSGSIDLTVTGNSGPFTYAWNNGATTQDINGLSTGIYSVVVSNTNGCTKSLSIFVSPPVNTFIYADSLCGTSVSTPLCILGCVNNPSNAVDASQTNYALINIPVGVISSHYLDLCFSEKGKAGDFIGFTIADDASLLEAQLIGGISITAFSSSGVVVASRNNFNLLDLTLLQPNGNKYIIGFQTPAGSYDIKRIRISIPALASVLVDLRVYNGFHTVSAVPTPTITAGSSTSFCPGGSVTLSAPSGYSSYSWSNGATSQNITVSASGNYYVRVIDAVTGCSGNSDTIPVVVYPGVAVTASNSSPALCFGTATGAITIAPSGGTMPYTFNWSNGATTQNISGVAAGNYSVTVTDAHGCTASVPSVTVTQPAASVSISTTSTNVACFGNSTASVTLVVNGGTAPYTYNWSNGASSQNLTNIPAGNYSVTVADANGCTANGAVVSVTQPSAALFTSVSSTQVLCYGNSTAGINLTVTGGTAPYNYSWSNGATSEDLQNITAGTYTVTVTDANGCTSRQASLQIQQPSAALAATVGTTTDVSCNGGQNGGINLNVTGGSSPYSYVWSNGATTQNITGVVAGIYSVTITDAHGCTKQINPIGINQPTNPITTSVTTGQNVSCNGGGNGSIDLTVTGGTAPYSYNWSNGATTQDISQLYAGTYGVSITDANGCTASATGTVSQPAGALSTSISASQNILCHNGNNGSVTLQATGGTAPYTFAWSNGATTQNLSNLQAGTFAVTVTDANGCISTSSTVITQPSAALSGVVSTANPVLCHGGNSGSIDATITGGTAPYTYQWSNGATTQDLTAIAAGTYTLSVTDANGCKTTLNGITINQPSAALASSVSTTNVNCFGGGTGAIDLTVTGGTAPYSYSWSNGATTQDLQNISAGTYSVNVIDANGCTISNTALSITQPAASLSTGFNVTDVTCFGNASGAITLTVTGGTSPYSFAWSNGSTLQNLINVPIGTYTVTVTDANGCTNGVASMQITQPAAALTMNNTIDDVNCFGGNTGSVNLTVSGGTLPYSFSWSNGASTQNLTNVAAGTYTVTVTDAQGCTVGNSTLTIQQPSAALASSITGSVQVACYGNNSGSVDLNVTGGTAPYNYVWSNGATMQDLTGIPAGTYTVSITDAQGCTSTIASINISQPAGALNGSVTSTGNVACNGGGNGSVDLTVTGGTAPYSFNWSNGATTEDITNLYAGTFNVSITDANGCTASATATVSQPSGALASSVASSQNISCFNQSTGSITLTVTGGTAPYNYVWSNGATTQNISNVGSGSYSVTVTDANNCISTSSVTLTQPTAALSASTSGTQNVSCFGIGNGSITLAVSGGTSPYSYVWSNGETTQNLANLQAGVYSVTVTDANGCTQNVNAIAISQPALPLTAAIGASQNVNCFGQSTGSISVNVNGGTSPYSYTWSNGATTQSVSNLPAGTYSVTVTDANNCTTAINSIAVNEPGAALASSISASQNVNCTGGANGSLDLTVTGGTTPYSYLWNTGATTEDLSALSAATYTVTVTDVNGCTSSITANVTQPSNVVSSNVNASANVNCFGGNNGSVDLTVAGGTAPYSYSWSNGEVTEDLANLVSGTYTVTVTDANGCTSGNTVTITQPTASLSSTVTSSQNINCFGGNNGAIDLTVAGGTAPYQFNWDNGATSEDLSGLGSGTYNVTVTDANGCTSMNSVFLSQPSASLTTAVTNSQNIFCNGGNNGFIDLTIAGGTLPYSILWSNGATTQNLNALTAGTYNVTVTDVNGCSSTTGLTIAEPSAALNTTISSSQPVLCFGNTTGSIDISVSGGTTPYTYNWSNGEVTEDLNNLSAGTYTVTVTDAQGCTYSINTTITQPQGALSSSISINQQVSCFGGNNASVDLTVSGGTPPYTFHWSDGSTTEDINNLAAGVYSVSITDANGCTLTGAATITQPTAALSGNITQTATILCYGGTDASVDLTITGGTAPYSYTWSNGATTEDLANIPAGVYSVSVSDQNGCTFSASVTITQPSGGLTPSIASTGNVGCYGNSTGSVTLAITGGTQPYQFIWNNGATTQSLTNVAAGSYTVTVTDANGCSNTATANVQQPSGSLSASPGFNTVNCDTLNSVDIILNPFGGTPPYSYNWSTGNTSENLLNVGAGTYAVTITDANGCTFNTSVNVQGPTQLFAVTAATTAAGCNGATSGSITLTATGGISPYTYVWSNGATTSAITNVAAGTYTATITDSYGCTRNITATITQPANAISATLTPNNVKCYNDSSGVILLSVAGGTAPYTFLWNNGATTQNATGITIGTYTVTVTDANGCSWSDNSSITQPASALTVKGYETNSNCLNSVPGAIDINITGGTPPFTYLWSNGATTQNVTGLGAGTYTVTVTDANGCLFYLSKTVIDESQLTMSANGPTEFCMGGIANLQTQTVANGTYQWYHNNNILNGANQNVYATPVAGTYYVSVTNACGTFNSNPVEVKVYQVGTISVSANQMICPNLGEFATLSAYGGSAYKWTPGFGLSDSTIANPVATPASTTTYKVIVTSNEGCSASAEVTISVVCDTLFVPTGFSPDGNNVNDTYVIDGLGKYPGNKIYVYNRWGNLVYKKKDYDNTWDGTSNVSGIFLGKQLPNGTYFFILDLNNGSKPMQGYITLKK